jgi:hypothetical protein
MWKRRDDCKLNTDCESMIYHQHVVIGRREDTDNEKKNYGLMLGIRNTLVSNKQNKQFSKKDHFLVSK